MGEVERTGGVGSEIVAIYRRVPGFARAWPLVFALPFFCAVFQRWVSSPGIVQIEQQRAVAIGFAAVNTVAMLIVSVCAFRWWCYEGDRRAVMRLSWRVPLGAVVMLVVQLTDEFILTMLGNTLAILVGGGKAIFRPGALLVWLFISVPLYPWYVGLIADDRGMTLRRAFAAIRPCWIAAFAVVLGSVLPLIILGLVLRIGGKFIAGPLGWTIQMADAVLVPLLITITASAYFATYRRAQSVSF